MLPEVTPARSWRIRRNCSPTLRSRLPGSDGFGDDCGHEAVDADAVAFRLFRQLGVESPGQALPPLGSRDDGLRQLSARLFENLDAIAESLSAVRDRLLDVLAIGHASGYIRILHQITAALILR